MLHSGAAELLTTSAFPAVVGFWMVTLLLTAALGFWAGIVFERRAVKRAFGQARSQVNKLFALVIETLESAREACALLDSFPSLRLTTEQTGKLDSAQTGLREMLSGIVATQQQAQSTQHDDADGVKRQREEFAHDWARTPEDSRTGLPDRSAFDLNLNALLAWGTEAETESGLLLIKVDKLSQLSSRFGATGAQLLLRKMAGLVCRALRDEDAMCQYTSDTFAVLLPDVSGETGKKLSHALRDTVRSHHFRLEESGPEILVTASFGYTRLLPHDNVELVENRAGNALAKSQVRGRNQLHAHDGVGLSHLQAG